MDFIDFLTHQQTTTLISEKVDDYALMLCDALYMNLKNQQIRSHQRSIREEVNMDYHQSKIEHIMNHGPDVEFYCKRGRKYLKLIMRDAGGQQHVHAFIDRNNGEVFKPASWQAPAKGVRFNLLLDQSREWLYEHADWAGGYLYK
jgi:hypothetical protein